MDDQKAQTFAIYPFFSMKLDLAILTFVSLNLRKEDSSKLAFILEAILTFVSLYP